MTPTQGPGRPSEPNKWDYGGSAGEMSTLTRAVVAATTVGYGGYTGPETSVVTAGAAGLAGLEFWMSGVIVMAAGVVALL